ncbi:hypothetical protein [Mycolicibacterium llatzerense]|uniref:hypothetical protein n=1 Tax=Mycolicibacterium llatzerense TaxID=280871 RepID=UPI0008DCA835|nr:hypothetical protein [Mycolicibacterium llatzerense]
MTVTTSHEQKVRAMDLAEFAVFAQELIDGYLPGASWRFRYDAATRRGGCCRFPARVISMSRWLVPM